MSYPNTDKWFIAMIGGVGALAILAVVVDFYRSPSHSLSQSEHCISFKEHRLVRCFEPNAKDPIAEIPAVSICETLLPHTYKIVDDNAIKPQTITFIGDIRCATMFLEK